MNTIQDQPQRSPSVDREVPGHIDPDEPFNKTSAMSLGGKVGWYINTELDYAST